MIHVMESVEIATSDSIAIQNDSASVAALRRGISTFGSSKPSYDRDKRVYNRPACSSCDSTSHVRSTCRFRHSTCDYCSRSGHIRRACRARKQSEQSKHIQAVDVARGVGDTASVCSGKLNAISISEISTIRPKMHVLLDLHTSDGRQPVSYTVDSNADITTITENMCQRYFANAPRKKCIKPVLNFDGSRIESYGLMPITVSLNGGTATTDALIVPDNFGAVLGMDLLHPLKTILDCGQLTVMAVTSTDSEFLHLNYPTLCSQVIGTYPNFQHHVSLSSDASPSVAKPRHPPLFRREKIANAIKSLVDDGIWEESTKPSEWMHNIVVVDKPDGTVRITADLSSLNRFITPDRYPLPSIRDLLVELSGSTVFSVLDLRQAFYHFLLDEESSALTTVLDTCRTFSLQATSDGHERCWICMPAHGCKVFSWMCRCNCVHGRYSCAWSRSREA